MGDKVSGKLQMDKMRGHKLNVAYCRNKCYLGRCAPTKENIAACAMLRRREICPLIRLLQAAPVIDCNCKKRCADPPVKMVKTNIGGYHFLDCLVTQTYGY